MAVDQDNPQASSRNSRNQHDDANSALNERAFEIPITAAQKEYHRGNIASDQSGPFEESAVGGGLSQEKKREEEKKKEEERKFAFEAALAMAEASREASQALSNAIAAYERYHKGDMQDIAQGLKALQADIAQTQKELNSAQNIFTRNGRPALDLNQVSGIDKQSLGLTGTHYVVAQDPKTNAFFVLDDNGQRKDLSPEQASLVKAYLTKHPEFRVARTEGLDPETNRQMMSVHILADQQDAQKEFHRLVEQFKKSDGNTKFLEKIAPVIEKLNLDPASLTKGEQAQLQAVALLQEYEHELAQAMRDGGNLTPEQIKHNINMLETRKYLLDRVNEGTLSEKDLVAARVMFQRNSQSTTEQETGRTEERDAPAPTPPRPLNELTYETLASIMEQVRASRAEGGYGLSLSKREIELLATANNISPTQLEAAIADRHPDIKLEGHNPAQNRATPDVALNTPTRLTPEQMNTIMASIPTLKI